MSIKAVRDATTDPQYAGRSTGLIKPDYWGAVKQGQGSPKTNPNIEWTNPTCKGCGEPTGAGSGVLSDG